MTTDYNPENYTTQRTSGLRDYHFRQQRDLSRRQMVIIALAAVLVSAVSIWLGGW